MLQRLLHRILPGGWNSSAELQDSKSAMFYTHSDSNGDTYYHHRRRQAGYGGQRA